jgi:hypothetical protein
VIPRFSISAGAYQQELVPTDPDENIALARCKMENMLQEQLTTKRGGVKV